MEIGMVEMEMEMEMEIEMQMQMEMQMEMQMQMETETEMEIHLPCSSRLPNSYVPLLFLRIEKCGRRWVFFTCTY